MYSRGLWFLLLFFCSPLFLHATRKGKKAVPCSLFKHPGITLDAQKEYSIKRKIARIMDLRKESREIEESLEKDLKEKNASIVVMEQNERYIHVLPRYYCKEEARYVLINPDIEELKRLSIDGTSLWLALHAGSIFLSDEEPSSELKEELEGFYLEDEKKEHEEEFEEDYIVHGRESDSEKINPVSDPQIESSPIITVTTSTTQNIIHTEESIVIEEPTLKAPGEMGEGRTSVANSVGYKDFTVVEFRRRNNSKESNTSSWFSLPAWPFGRS